ncbi:MAG: hypothetical protein QF797_19595 [Alphaproteobacteria bacterium]|jgi:hypothetical protein|nr:hypothetical protein [Alphaproteobacteria bacterium]MDP6621256.1 hypothetical protein [Alphaproteobacteria bacterium]|tara:strand:+ start:311 stop:754 length:444 start_codon:yes stop_codon:yes gene_type:complete
MTSTPTNAEWAFQASSRRIPTDYVATVQPVTSAAPEPDPGNRYQGIVSRYNVGTMTGTEAVRFANDLIATGVEETDALAVTLPITSRNLLNSVGKASTAPKIENWNDVVRHHQAQHELAQRRASNRYAYQLERLITLAQDLQEAEAA